MAAVPLRAPVTALIVGGISALTLTACTVGGVPSTEVELGAAPPGDVVSLPQDFAVMLTDAVAALPDTATEILDGGEIPGAAVAVVHDDEVVFAEGFGVASIDSDRPVTTETVFQIASMSKPISATAVAAAIHDDPSLTWTAPISSLDPSFALADPTVTAQATVGDAFSHGLGLATGAGDDLEDLGFAKADIMSTLDHYPLTAFRAEYHYSNFGLTTGADAVAASRGQTWDEAIDELLFAPLGMTSSSVRHSDLALREDRALLHARVDGTLSTDTARNADAQAPAGGVSASVTDLTAWMRMVLNGGQFNGTTIADEDALAAAMSAQVVRGSGQPQWRAPLYGYGFNVDTLATGRTAISHSGGFVSGAASNVQFIPSLDLGIVTITNAPPTGAPEAINAAFLDLVQFGDVTRDWASVMTHATAELTAPVGDLVDAQPPASAASPTIQDPTGRYTNSHFGDLVISASADGYVASLGADGLTQLTLTHWDGDTYAYEPRTENAPDGSKATATFNHGADGSVTVTLTTFDDNGFGTWTLE